MPRRAVLLLPLLLVGAYLLDRLSEHLPGGVVAGVGAVAFVALAFWVLRHPGLRHGQWSTCRDCGLPLDGLGNPASAQHTRTPCPHHGALTLPQ